MSDPYDYRCPRCGTPLEPPSGQVDGVGPFCNDLCRAGWDTRWLARRLILVRLRLAARAWVRPTRRHWPD